MGLTKTAAVVPTILSPLGKACARMDLTAVHDILLKTGYKDEEGAENEVNRTVYILERCKCFHYQTFLYSTCNFKVKIYFFLMQL